MDAPHSNDTLEAILKVAISWIGAMWGVLTLQNLVLVLTAVYTAINLYVVVRDRIIRRERERDRD